VFGARSRLAHCGDARVIGWARHCTGRTAVPRCRHWTGSRSLRDSVTGPTRRPLGPSAPRCQGDRAGVGSPGRDPRIDVYRPANSASHDHRNSCPRAELRTCRHCEPAPTASNLTLHGSADRSSLGPVILDHIRILARRSRERPPTSSVRAHSAMTPLIARATTRRTWFRHRTYTCPSSGRAKTKPPSVAHVQAHVRRLKGPSNDRCP
jgi:hypothetical protein